MKIDIVVPSFNQYDFLRKTLESLLSQQGCFDLSVMVMDGGSTDDTVSLLGSIQDPRLTWVSRKDRGQSDAINQGLRQADGDVVSWLNSDDLYTPGTLASVAENFTLNPRAQWLVGRCENIDVHGRIIRRGITRYKNRCLDHYSYRQLLRRNFISQMSVFWRRDFGQAVGPLDESLHYTMDYDLWLRMGRRADPLVLDRVLGLFRLHDRSKSGQVNRRQFDEEYAVACRYVGRDRMSRWLHRLHVEEVVWAYRLMRVLGR